MADIPPNIEAFNRAVLYTLGRLYGSFPIKSEIDPVHENIAKLFYPGPEGQKMAQETREEFGGVRILFATVEWLVAEGFVAIEGRGKSSEFKGAVLTHKGLSLMNTPTSLSKKPKTYGQIALEVASGGTKKAVSDVVSKMLTAGLCLAVELSMARIRDGGG